MATLRTVTVKSSAGDYTTLSAAEAGEQGNLVTLDRELLIECHALTDTANVTFAGWTTDATRFVRVEAASGSAYTGVYTTSGRYVLNGTGASGVYTLNAANASTFLLKLKGLQIRRPNGSSFNYRIGVGTATANNTIEIDGCYVEVPNTGTGGPQFISALGTADFATAVVKARNSVFKAQAGSINTEAVVHCDQNGVIYLHNCVIDASGSSAAGVLRSTGGTVTITNSVVFNSTASDVSGSGITTTYSATDDSVGSNGVTLGNSTQWNAAFTNYAAGDYTIKDASSPLYNAGTDLSGNANYPVTTDIAGTSRPQSSAYDIGISEFVSSGTNATATPSGVSGTGERGTLAVSAAASSTIIGQAGTGANGSLQAIAEATAALSGQVGSTQVGTLATAAAANTAITGQAGTGQQGTVTVSTANVTNVSLSGVGATGQTGTLTVRHGSTVSLSGQAGTGSTGTQNPTAAANTSITGQAAATAVGTLTIAISRTVALAGVAASGALGTLTAIGNAVLSLSGVNADGSVGTLNSFIRTATVNLTGVAGTAQAGDIDLDLVSPNITGQAATGSTGQMYVWTTTRKYEMQMSQLDYMLRNAGDLCSVSGSASTFYGIMRKRNVLVEDGTGNEVMIAETVLTVSTETANTLPERTKIYRFGTMYYITQKEVAEDGELTELTLSKTTRG